MNSISFTPIQNSAFGLLHSPAVNVLLYGGARSGKTYMVLCEMVFVALQYPGSRQLAGRLYLTDALASLWTETLLKVLSDFVPSAAYKTNKTEHVVRFTNGSEIFVAGFDDKERTEKILGREFCRIYLNECSQLSYNTVVLVKTRLAQKVDGLVNKMFYDENPPSPSHWTYKLFIQGMDPKSNLILKKPDAYCALQMNPIHNIENLPDGYLDQLAEMPEEQRRRFLDGEFVTPAGSIFRQFDREKHLIAFEDIPDCEMYSVGVDLGKITAAILIGFWKEFVYVIDEIYEEEITNSSMNDLIEAEWGEYPYVCYLDHNHGPAVLQEYSNSYPAVKGNNSVAEGNNLMQQLFEKDRLLVCEDCIVFIYQLESYRRNEKTGKPIKVEDHALDAGRYAIYSEKEAEPLYELVG
ncbi:MAG: phage terminase large subunit [Candidatus Thorarchaeota archaeon]